MERVIVQFINTDFLNVENIPGQEKNGLHSLVVVINLDKRFTNKILKNKK